MVPGPLRPLARALARSGAAHGLLAHPVVHGAGAREEDAEWAADEVVRRYGDVPVCLVGYDAGGRAVLRAGATRRSTRFSRSPPAWAGPPRRSP